MTIRKHRRHGERVWAVVSLTGVADFHLAGGLAWMQPNCGGRQQRAYSWPRSPLPPVVVPSGSLVFVSAPGLPALGAFAAALTALNVSAFGIGIAMIVGAATATLATVWLVSKRSGSDWIEAVLIAGIAATGIAVPIAAAELPATELIVMILLAVGGQAIAYGIVFDRQALVALGPPALGLAAIMLVAESASGSALWFTVPIAVVMLAEADILHRMTVNDRGEQRSIALLILEWSGVALLGLPPLVEMFATGIVFGLVGFAFAVGLLMWALLTKVKRRVLAACVVATLSTMLTLAAAGASNVQFQYLLGLHERRKMGFVDRFTVFETRADPVDRVDLDRRRQLTTFDSESSQQAHVVEQFLHRVPLRRQFAAALPSRARVHAHGEARNVGLAVCRFPRVPHVRR